MQVRYNCNLTGEEYVTIRAWLKASAPDCPWHAGSGCRLAPHGSYPRKSPPGTRVKRFRCQRSGRTVSLLPDCLASYLPGTLAQVQEVERAARRAHSREAAANQLRPSGCSLVSAVRWVRQPRQPLARQGVNARGRELAADRLQPLRVGAAEQAVVERLEADALPLQLALDVLVPVEAQLGVVGEGRSRT